MVARSIWAIVAARMDAMEGVRTNPCALSQEIVSILIIGRPDLRGLRLLINRNPIPIRLKKPGGNAGDGAFKPSSMKDSGKPVSLKDMSGKLCKLEPVASQIRMEKACAV